MPLVPHDPCRILAVSAGDPLEEAMSRAVPAGHYKSIVMHNMHEQPAADDVVGRWVLHWQASTLLPEQVVLPFCPER